MTEWQGTTKQGITLRQAMQLSSGLANDVENLQGLDPAATDLYDHAVNNVGFARAPGTAFSYGPVNYYVVGAMIQRIITTENLPYQNPLDSLQKNFLDKIGIQYSDWAHDASGNPHIPNGAYFVPRQWIHWGQFILQNGVWNGEALVDENLLLALAEPAATNPGHGLFTWLNTQGGFGLFSFQTAPTGSLGGMIYYNGHNDIIGYLGAGKNRIYVIPTKDLVVVRQTLQEEDSFEDHVFLDRLLKGN